MDGNFHPAGTDMRKLTAIIGVPCVGKSTLVRRLMAETGEWEYRPRKNLAHHYHPATNTVLLGRYDEDHQFPGTDRLSMGVQPHAVAFLKEHTGSIIFEGARLSTGSFIQATFDAGWDFRLCWLGVDADVLNARRAAERVQSEKFLQASETKVRNLVKAFPDHVQWFDVTTSNDRPVNWLRAARLR